MRKKAAKLTRQKKIAIGKFKDKNPKATYYEISDTYSCTYEQARSACVAYKKGELTRVKSRAKTADVDEILENQTADDLLEKQYHTAVAQLQAETKLSVEDRVKLLSSLFSMRKILQQLRLESFIKRADAGVIKIIIKKFLPDCTDDDVIKIYLEAVERWKMETL